LHEKGDPPIRFDWRLTSWEYYLFLYFYATFISRLQDLGDILLDVSQFVFVADNAFIKIALPQRAFNSIKNPVDVINDDAEKKG